MELQKLLDYFDITILEKPEVCRNYTKMELIDSDGYKYYLDKNNLTCAYGRKSIPNKFFRNPHTEYNLQNYLNIHSNGDVIIKDFQNAKDAHDPILLYCYSADIEYNKNGNEITSGQYLLKQQMPGWTNPNRYSLDFVKSEAYKYGVEIVDDTYTNNITPIKFICLKHKDMGVQEKSWVCICNQKYPCRYCLQEYRLTRNPPHPISSNSNPKRKSHNKRTKEQRRQDIVNKFNKNAKVLKNPNIEIVGEYVGAHEKIECKCLKCGATFYLRPDHIRRGIGHSGCNKSLGEERTEIYLKNNKYRYICQYRFDDCIRKERSMPFDFYLPDLNIAIEYDGIQHYQPVMTFGGEEAFAELKLNDAFKTEYCYKNNIKLIRIPYTEYNTISEFLDKELKGNKEVAL